MAPAVLTLVREATAFAKLDSGLHASARDVRTEQDWLNSIDQSIDESPEAMQFSLADCLRYHSSVCTDRGSQLLRYFDLVKIP
jgi:hypothetical protein